MRMNESSLCLFLKKIIFSVLLLVSFVSCRPSIKKESNTIRHTVSMLDTISPDNVLLIKREIKESNPALLAYQNKVRDILASENIEYSPEEIFLIQEQLLTLFDDKVERYDKHLTGLHRKVFRKSLLGGVNRSFKLMLELDTVATSQFSKLSKDEKINYLDRTKANIVKEFEGMSAVDEYFRKRVYNTTEALLRSNKFLD